MTTLLTLIKTEYIKRKSSYWIPVWVIAGIVAVALLVGGIATMTNSVDIQVNLMDFSFDYEDMQEGMRAGSLGSLILVLFVFSIALMVNAPNSLSKEKQLGCDLFYRCQPVNIWLSTLAKYIMHVLAGLVWVLGVGFIYTLVFVIVSSITMGGFYLGASLLGLIMAGVIYLKISLVFGSLFFLFSAMFKNNGLLKGLILLGLVDLVFFLIEQLLRNTVDLPSVYSLLVLLLGNLNIEEASGLQGIVLDLKFLISFFFAGACYTGATLIYKSQPTEA